MTRIFEALKKARVPHAPAATPATAPIQPVRAHMAGAPAAGVTPERLGLDVRTCVAPPEIPEEAVREMTALRMTLETSLKAGASRVVLFTSALRGEGTSTIAAQFAAVVAGDPHQRVLLMDLNARRPSEFVEKTAGADASEPPGVQAIRPPASSGGRFDVVPVPARARETGVVPAPAAREWVAALTHRYDWVVLDAPAVLEAPDGPPLAAVADGVVVVVEAGRTKRPVLHRAIDLLRKARANLIGSVLNRRRLEIPEFLYRRI